MRVPPRRKKYTWKRLLLFCSFVLLMSVGILGVFAYYKAGLTYTSTENPFKQLARSVASPGSVAFADRSRLIILGLGVDYNHDAKDVRYTKWARSDTMFLIAADKDAKGLSIVSIPRDLWVDIPGHGPDKINSAFSLKENGDLELTTRTVEKLLDVHIDHTVVIKEYAAQRLVDAMGGVTVDVPKDMNYDDNWGHLHIHLKKGPRHLTGEQAVGFVRFRHDEEGDRGRIRRQQQFMDAMLKEFRKPENLTRVKSIVRAIEENIQTSLTFAELLDLANVYKGFNRKLTRTAKIDGTDVVHSGAACIEVDEAEKKRIVDSLLKGIPLQEPRDLKLSIVDQSGIEGAGKRVADYYKARGYQDCTVRPPAHVLDSRYNLTHLSTRHRDNDYASSLKALQEGYIDINVTSDDDSAQSDYTIVLGRDWGTRARPDGLMH